MDDGFDDLLNWLDPDRESAGRRYELIRAGLVRIFVSNGFSDAEDLADVTLVRVAGKLAQIREEYVGEKERYFYGVARNIIHEARRRREVATGEIPERAAPPVRPSDRYDCLMECLGRLPLAKREMILDYYLYAGADKIEHHRRMAEEVGISDGALRKRAHHLRRNLEACVLECVENLARKQKTSARSFLKKRHLTDAVNEEHQP